MAYVTQAMRRKMADDAHEARHPERAAERIAYRAAVERARAEMKAKFPRLTAENFEEANRFFQTRIQELVRSANRPAGGAGQVGWLGGEWDR